LLLDRLEHLALTDMDARREYVRELTRRGDVRGSLLELSIERDNKDSWLEIHKTIEGDDTMIEWLSGYLGHWIELDLYKTQVIDLSPLADLTNLERLDLSFTQVTNLSPIQHLIDAGLELQGL